ncbi:AraC family transcriptional regulator [Domibacillus sp. A3M-37]|uniref:AraC family transcriptional regulator n=1 Tax=Domibacillus sp. A3M-37 TaxID=2962037 RepID=UPI0020B8A118|nr:AraC family transcriptional regulator [Domibacillus sp. A3M-37]MCP3763658.1 AraC family transcriptional regulator [Domibacillus sp. A3M-37]
MDQAINRLKKQCIYAGGRSVSFHVYSWGAPSNHPDNPLHKHSFFELCYVFGGTGHYYEGGHHYPLTKGMFFCTKPEKLHRVYKGQDLSLFWTGFNVDAASSGEACVRYAKQMAEAEDLIAHNVEDTPAFYLLKALILQASSPCSTDILHSLSHSFMLSLQTLFYTTERILEDSSPDDAKRRVLVNQVQLFVRDNLNRSLSIKEVSQYLHISTRHLSRLFANYLGVSFTDFVRRERVDAAAQAFRMTTLGIKTIAGQYSFSSVHYSTRVFQEEIGVTLGQYRKKSQR